MDEHTIQVLEYRKVLAIVARYASSDAGRRRVLGLTPLADPAQVTGRLVMVSEVKRLHEWGESPDLAGIQDIHDAISKSKVPGAVLDARSLLGVLSVVAKARRVKDFFRTRKDKAPAVGSLAANLRELPDLEDAINGAVDEDGNIRDSASPGLKRIRQEKAKVSARISSALSGILARDNVQSHLQDSIVTIRNGRYVIPVRAEARTKIPGIVHDTSHSGATVFIEPMATVALNNTLRSLELDEKDEIVRILSALTDRVGRSADDLVTDMEVLTDLDTLNAAARFSVDFGCIEPVVSTGGLTMIRGGRHPVLVETLRSGSGGSIVPLDVTLGGQVRGLLITGPNTGGKTVALKTIGILTLMARTGLHVPCSDGTEITLFGKVYADIGDEQSIELSLSTFSSHMKNTIAILDRADGQTLALLDEVGAGTDPQEGSALARTVIESLLENGATLVATTHHMGLKAFAHKNPLLENASMEFDADNLEPTYRLIQGIPGASHAFEIASSLGLPKDLLDKARAYCGEEQVKFEELTRELLNRMKQISEQEAGIEARRSLAEAALSEYERRLDEIKKYDRDLRKKALREAKTVVADARRTVKQLVRELSEKPEPERAREIESRISRQAETIERAIEEIETAEESRRPLTTFVVGARVYVKPLSSEGTLLSEPDARGRLEVAVGALRAEVAKSDLYEPAGDAAPQPARTIGFEAKEVPAEIDVRGMTAEEAWEVVDRYLDDASLHGHISVRVIHGKGRGILSKRIRQMLVSHPRVKTHRFGESGEGGTGVTIVGLDKD